MNSKSVAALVASIVSLFYFPGCKSNLKTTATDLVTKVYDSGKFIIKIRYDNDGRIKTKQFFNKDTIPDGAEFVYANGRLNTWRWYTTEDSLPLCGVYYDAAGAFDTFEGNPFLRWGNTLDNSVYIDLVKPPQINYIVIIEDSCTRSRRIAFDPEETDTKWWLLMEGVRKPEQIGKHKYLVYCYVADSNRHRFTRIPIAMLFPATMKFSGKSEHKCEYVEIPSKSIPLPKEKGTTW